MASDTVVEGFFSWTARRVTLVQPRSAAAASAGPMRTLRGVVDDIRVLLGSGNSGRLISHRTTDCDMQYLVLVIGKVPGVQDVPIRVVDEEVLLVEGSRSTGAPEILVADPTNGASDSAGRRARAEVNRQLCCGGPLRELVTMSGAVSVDVEWCTPYRAA